MYLFRRHMQSLATCMLAVLLFLSVPVHAKKKEPEKVPAHMEERVAAVFAALSKVIAGEHPDVTEYTIAVVVEKTPNAWINQRNEIYVSSGLLDLLATDDQLAGVIGHEIAHGTQGHIPHRVSQSIWTAFAVIALGTVAHSQGSSDWGGLIHMRDLFMYAFGREQESEADLVGMGYARAAGYAAEGLVEALQLLDKDRRKLPSDSIWQQLYRTHPPISRRITDLRFILATEQLNKMTLGVGTLSSAATGARSPEEAALHFGQALLSGDEAALRPYVLPGKAGSLLASVMEADSPLADCVDERWAEAELEVIDRPDDSAFGTRLLVRLWRASDRARADGIATPTTETSGPPLLITLQKSARGWVVTEWERAACSEQAASSVAELNCGVGRDG